MIGTIIPAGLLILLGIIYISTGGHNHMDMSQGFFPDLSKFDNLVLASSIFLFYAGMEMMGIHVMDVKNPSRNYPKAIIIGSLVTVLHLRAGYFLAGLHHPGQGHQPHAVAVGRLRQLLPLPAHVVGGPDHRHRPDVRRAGRRADLGIGSRRRVSSPWAEPVTCLRSSRRATRTAYSSNILLIQGGVVTLLALLFVVMPSVQSFYQILSQLTVLLYLIMYMLMFSAAIVLRYKMKGTDASVPPGQKG